LPLAPLPELDCTSGMVLKLHERRHVATRGPVEDNADFMCVAGMPAQEPSFLVCHFGSIHVLAALRQTIAFTEDDCNSTGELGKSIEPPACHGTP
jgi:hypothetical protein